MTGAIRRARPCVALLVTVALVLGINGFVGAIHSVHHLPALAQTDADSHDSQAHEHDREGQNPGGGPQESCPVATAALHLAATAIDALPDLLLPLDGAALVAIDPQGAPRVDWRLPARGRAPPSPGPLSS